MDTMPTDNASPFAPPPPSAPAPAAPPAPPPRRRGGCLTGVVCGCALGVLLFVAGIVAVPLALFYGFAYLAERMPGATQTAGTADYLSCRGEGTNEVLRLTLNGIIAGSAPSGWYTPPDCDAAVLREIEDAIEDDDFRAILLVVDSPGGGVTASDAVYHALGRFKASRPDRKVVVLAGDLLASGAYYLAMQADWIRLRPTTVVGSIGVIIPTLNAADLAQRLGIRDASIASGESKDLLNPLKPIDPRHVAILRGVADAMYARFVGLVAKGRKLPEAEVRALADGRVFSAQDAVNLRLADDIGYEDTLDAKIAELLGCAEEELVIYEPHRSRASFFRGMLSEFPARLRAALLAPEPPRVEYRY